MVAGQRLPIVVATKPVDFRCGHQALALIVQEQLKLDPHSGVTVIFRSKRGDRLKILVWDGSGLVLIYKRLEQGSFAWPKIQDDVTRVQGLDVLMQPEPVGQARQRIGPGLIRRLRFLADPPF